MQLKWKRDTLRAMRSWTASAPVYNANRCIDFSRGNQCSLFDVTPGFTSKEWLQSALQILFLPGEGSPLSRHSEVGDAGRCAGILHPAIHSTTRHGCNPFCMA